MPIVPRYPVPQVETAPLPAARVSADAPAAAFGVPAAPDLSGVQRVFAQIVEEERQKADQLAVLDADNQLAQLGTDLETRALSRRGKEAFGALGETADEWQRRTAEI